MANLVLVAPMAGWVAPLDEVPDPVFADRLLGDGVAIDPVSATLHAPCDGIVASSAAHALTIRAPNGAEILIHIGLETVALGGQGFILHAREGRTVKTGDPLIAFDLDYVASRAKSLISPVIVTNGDAFTIARRELDKRVATGEFLMEVAPLGAASAFEPDATVEREALVRLAHGIHARPAAVLANAAKRFSAGVSLSVRNRSVNARSVAALMSLGVRHGDRVTLRANGADAENAARDLASLIEKGLGETPVSAPASTLDSRSASKAATAEIKGVVRGVCASPGTAYGPVAWFKRAEIAVREAGSGIATETAALEKSLAEVRTRLELTAAHGDRERRGILGAHISLLEDPEILRAAHNNIVEGKSAAFAVRVELRRLATALEQSGDALMRERAHDLIDLEQQLLAHLSGGGRQSASMPRGSIVIADEVLPSELVQLEQSGIAGLCLARGGPTSHVAILARGMNLPALVSTGPAVLNIAEGANAILDADAGLLRLDPDEASVAAVRANAEQRAQKLKLALTHAQEECRTADRVRIEVFANLGADAAEPRVAVESGAEGCGLLRTEFLFLDRATPPDEAEQAAAYQAIADALGGRPLIIRTLDVGGDKPVPYLPLPPEENPALGLRGVRVSLAHPELLRGQLGAILRVRPAGQCRILLPMITSISEIQAVRKILAEVVRQQNLDPAVAVGAMIETPASALMAAEIADEVDFLSIGSNDLTQYTLAMDRTNPSLAQQADALHPAVLRLIAQTAAAGRQSDKPVAVCGGMAGDSAAVPLLIGFGVRELSVPGATIPLLKHSIRTLTIARCEAAAEQALQQTSAQGVRALVAEQFEGLAA